MINFIQKHKKDEQLLNEILTSITDSVGLKDHDGKWCEVNQFTLNLLGLEEKDLLEKTDIFLAKEHPYFKDFFIRCWETDEETYKNKRTMIFQEQFYDIHDKLRILRIVKVPFFEQDGTRKAMVVLGKDITTDIVNKQELASTIKELSDFKFALDQSSIVAITDHRGRITYANERFCEISKYSKDELMGQDHRILNSRHHSKKFFLNMWKTIRKGKVWEGDIKNRAKDGSYYWVKTTIIPFLNDKNKPYQYISIRQDITEQKKISEQILHNAYHDDLTGLPNRRCFRKDMEYLLDDIQEIKELAVIFLDLNRFKYVNDALGHSTGDQILIDVATRLSNYLQGTAELYRFGGDEFIIVIKNMTKIETREFIKDTSKLFLAPFMINNERYYLSASFGVSLYPKDGTDMETLIKKADSAMYLAKAKGNNTVQFYFSNLSENMSRTMKLESALRDAVDDEQFILHYQPKLDLMTKEIIGAESLIRWNHPELGIIPPSEFIPLAEETGLIIPMTEWVLETACKQNQEWRKEGLKEIQVGVNISSCLFNKNLISQISQVLEDSNLQPRDLDLEITESLLQTPDISIPILHQLKQLGVSISIDDFGTGYSSLAYLRDFPIDCLKIDQSFIRDFEIDNGAIIKMIIDMAFHLNVDVVAEGIETREQLSFLTGLGCDVGQGYFFSRPVPGNEISKLLFIEEKPFQ